MAIRRVTWNPNDLIEEPDSSAETEDDLRGVSAALMSGAVVWSTDWTAGTIVDQLRRGTIALDPVFQRRDAWTDERKSRFIESLFMGLPIPQLVLAETKAKGRFIVIDGKQRLLSLSKFTGVGLAADQEPLRLSGLKVREELNSRTFEEISTKSRFSDAVAEFENQPIRTVVIRGWTSEEVLYTIFHRLNTGSVPLSTQELRQALHPGRFLTFAAEAADKSTALQTLLGLDKPDFRMRDVELVVRFISFKLGLRDYKGNLKKFLDDTCDHLNRDWVNQAPFVERASEQMNLAIEAAMKIFGQGHAFRKWDGAKFEGSFNRAIFDPVATSLANPRVRRLALEHRSEVVSAFKRLSLEVDFRASVESTTKSKVAVRVRFSKWYRTLGRTIGMKIPIILPPE